MVKVNTILFAFFYEKVKKRKGKKKKSYENVTF